MFNMPKYLTATDVSFSLRSLFLFDNICCSFDSKMNDDNNNSFVVAKKLSLRGGKSSFGRLF